MSHFTVTEPHPTVPQGSYTRAGRGGAGNFFRAPATTPASGVPSVAKPLPPTSSRFYSGRGGAGNAHAGKERTTLSFDEQFKLQSHIDAKPTGYVGRGGAGNHYGSGKSSASQRKESDAASHRSNSSSGSVKSGFLRRLSSISSKGPHP